MCPCMCDAKTTKVIAVVVAFFYIIAGMVALGYGVGLHLSPYDYVMELDVVGGSLDNISGPFSEACAIFLLVLGIFSIISGFLVIVAVASDNQWLLRLSALMLFVLMIASIVLIVIAATYPVEENVEKNMRATMIRNFNNSDLINKESWIVDLPVEQMANSWAQVQMQAKCCGVRGAKDYLALPPENRSEVIYPGEDPMEITVPLSCCEMTLNDQQHWVISDLNSCVSLTKPAGIHTQGCLKTVKKFYVLMALPVLRLAPILLAFQIVLLLFIAQLIFFNNYEQIK